MASQTYSSGWVPNININGFQDHKHPQKDKAGYQDLKESNFWKTISWGANRKQPSFPTRTELYKYRQKEIVPDISYDIDKDGVVGHRDYFIGKSFDLDRDSILNEKEKAECDKALRDGWLDKFSLGHEKRGIYEPRVQQRRGKMLRDDNGGVISETYPPHFNADNVPKHTTVTDLKNDRLAELKACANERSEKWFDDNPIRFRELKPKQEFFVENPAITSIKQRAEADHQEQRVRSGLLPVMGYVNPERELMQPTLAYVDNPEFHTRVELKEHRKKCMKRDLEQQRQRGEETMVPNSVRRAKYEAGCTKFRQSDLVEKTRTQMFEQRRRDKLEYDRTHFGLQNTQYPRYSDQTAAWWELQKKVARPEGFITPRPELKRTASAPSTLAPLKVTDTAIPYFAQQYVAEKDMQADVEAEINKEEREKYTRKGKEFFDYGAKTRHKWTSEQIALGALKNKKRIFDDIKQLKTTLHDHMPIDMLSSFEYIRQIAQKDWKDKKAAGVNPSVMAQQNNPNNKNSSDIKSSSEGKRPRSVVSSRPGTRSFDPTCSDMPNFQTVVINNSGDVDPNMMDRTSLARTGARSSKKGVIPRYKGEDFGVRSGGFQRMEQLANNLKDSTGS